MGLSIKLLIFGVILLVTISPLYVFADLDNNSTTDNLQPDDKLLLDKTIVKLLQKQSSFEGEALIASATVFAFVGFGSFLSLKFDSKDVKYLFDLINYILFCVFAIGGIQLYIMISIIGGWFSILSYEILMTITGVAFGLILFLVRLVMGEENQDRDKQIKKIAADFLKSFTEGLEK